MNSLFFLCSRKLFCTKRAVRETFVLGTVNEVNASRAVSLTVPNAAQPLCSMLGNCYKMEA